MALGSGPMARVVGRNAEAARLAAVLTATASGRSATLLITGEAGVGKTVFAEQALHSFGGELAVIKGVCVPMQALNAPLDPLLRALRNSDAAGAYDLLRHLEAPDHAPQVLDAWIDQLSLRTPVVVLLDDLQWADQSTLDVITYLAAGPADRRLLVLATVRRDPHAPSHPLNRWLPDALRLRGVSQLELGGLDREGTQAQLADLLGAVPHQSLVDDLYARTQGNPYWSRLISQGLPPQARRLPTGLPADLITAVRAVWDALSPDARQLGRLLAVSGRPVSADALQGVATGLGWGEQLPELRECVQSRLLHLVDGERYWFDHPLPGEVLQADLTTTERRRWHAAYAEFGEGERRAGVPVTLHTAIALAQHHDSAGHLSRTYDWILRAWELAGPSRGSPELLALLERAIALRASVVSSPVSVHQLLMWLWETARGAGADTRELSAIDRLLGVVDERAEPLLVSELLARRMLLRYTVGAGFAEIEDVRRAVALAAGAPGSWQYAMALAEVAHVGFWAADPGAPKQAETSLIAARESAHPRALCLALAANAMREILAGRREAGLAYARESLEQAILAREWLGYVMAALWEHRALSRTLGASAADTVRRRRVTLTEQGAPQTYIARLSATEAEAHLWTGDWRACQDRLRVTLGSDPGPFADVIARLVAARLAVWQGRLPEAVAHFERADELVDDPSRYLNFSFAAARTEVLLATGRPVSAYRAAVSGIERAVPFPDLTEWLVPLAARALADQAQAARDLGQPDGDVFVEVARLLQRCPLDAGSADPQPSAQQPALASWYRAEVARARAQPDVAEVWRRTYTEAGRSQLPWVAAYAGWRSAEALLAGGPAQRRDGRRLLRESYDRAAELGAAPILAEIEALGRTARVPVTMSVGAPAVAQLPGLTSREREILEHIVRGSTYAEIAAALVIAEKTVSTHVSNLLRKTGTSGRVELARLATRVENAGSATQR